MHAQPLQLLGALSIERGRVPFLVCPHCAARSESLLQDAKGLLVCNRCQSHAAVDAFVVLQLDRRIAVCAGCRSRIPLTPDYAAALGFLCPRCRNYVALHYGRGAVQPRLVLDVRWNPDLRPRARRVIGGLRFVLCRSKRDETVLNALQVRAKAEEPSFRFGRLDQHEAALLLVGSGKGRYAGYIVWTVDAHAVLRQIFIFPRERRRGLARAAMMYWAVNHAEPVASRFGIESPNKKSMNLLVRLGYAKRAGRRVVGDKCFFVLGGV